MPEVSYDFRGATALVIGGTSGIGAATAELFARSGANVVIAGLFGEETVAWAEDLARSTPSTVQLHSTDVTHESQIKSLMEGVEQDFGVVRFAINNAGIEGPFGRTEDMITDDFDRLVSVNMRGIWLGMKYQIQHMRRHGAGSIVNTSSSAGITAIPMVAAYTGSKHGVVGLTKAAALEVAKDSIRINAVAPGPIQTGLLERMVSGKLELSEIAAQVPMGRIAAASEVAQAIAWLASDAASFVTGHALVVDGGMTVP